MPRTWQHKGIGGKFEGFTEAQRRRLFAAARRPENITYSQIACSAGVSKSSVIASGARPRGNMLRERAVKSPVIVERLARRRLRVSRFLVRQAFAKQPVSVNSLQRRFGGEKRFLGEVMSQVDKALYAQSGIRIIRRTRSDQPKRGASGPCFVRSA